MNSCFPFLGNLIDAGKVMSYIATLPDSIWTARCSATENINCYRPNYDSTNYDYYNINNSVYNEIIVSDEYFIDESFFSTIKAKKKGYVAKIIWSDPGNTEPPHIDFFPSFIGKTKDDGTHWSLEELENNRKNIIRVWIPLKNSEVGHILFSTKDALVNWSAGDVFHLPSDTVHGFTNAGRTRRYVLSITAWRL